MFYSSNGQQITRATYYALLGAAMYSQIGRYACHRFVVKNGSSVRLLTLARQLQAAS